MLWRQRGGHLDDPGSVVPLRLTAPWAPSCTAAATSYPERLQVKAWPHTRENHMKSCIWHENTNLQSNFKKFIRYRVRCVHPPKMMNKKPKLTISTIWWVNRILATVIISFLLRFCVWQFSAVCISCKTYSLTICYVFRLTSMWLVIMRG